MFELTFVTRRLNFNLRVDSNTADALPQNRSGEFADSMSLSQMATLAQQIEAVYTLSELRQMSFFLNVNFENLLGHTLFEKAYELVLYFQSRGMSEELYDYLAKDRAHIHWEFLFAKLPD